MLVLQLEVVPVLAPHEHAAVAVFQFQIVDALEDLREGFTLLEVLAAVVTRARCCLPSHSSRIVVGNEFWVAPAHGPAGTD
ncbi:hypothetical protein D9M69_641080 [compost metagenome]